MRRLKASAMALIIAATTLLYAYVLYKPSDHEAVSELPTAQADVLAPPTADSIPKSAVVAKPAAPVVVAETPRTSVVAKEANKPATSNVKSTQKEAEVLTVEATFYTANCKGCSGITKTGVNVRKTIYVDGYRIIAVDPKAIPLRSIVRVTLANGTTFKAVASDIGSAIKGNRIDVLVATKKEAYALGRMSATVEILRKGDD